MAEGHRERLREDYLRSGLEGMSDLHILELLLTYCIPRMDTNPLAHRLLEKFGTLNAVLYAPVSELVQVDGLGNSSAVFLHLIPDVMRRAGFFDAEKIGSLEDAKNFFASRLSDLPEEHFYLLCLRSDYSICHSGLLEEGSVNSVQINPRKIAKIALSCNATAVIIAHNHPSGFAKPSDADVSLTRRLESALTQIDVSLLDHIIVAGKEVFSFSENNQT